LIVDQKIELKQTDWALVEILEQFEPYGWSNYQPRFLIEGLLVQQVSTVGNTGSHLRLMVKQGNLQRKIICFGFGELCDQLKDGDTIDAVCEIGVNEWNGNREIQLSLVDIKKLK